MTLMKYGAAGLIVGVCVASVGTQSRTPVPAAAPRAVAAAQVFLATLDSAQRAKASLPLNATTRTVWSNLPTGIKMQVGATERNGLKFGSMNAAQQDAALAMIAAVLSRDGYRKVLNIVNADQRLEETSAPSRAASSAIRFGRNEYYLAILGTPAATGRWMVQFGGHHLAINVTISGGDSVLTPSHTGAQPATYVLNGETIRPLGKENDKAFALINALEPSQQQRALLGTKCGIWCSGLARTARRSSQREFAYRHSTTLSARCSWTWPASG